MSIGQFSFCLCCFFSHSLFLSLYLIFAHGGSRNEWKGKCNKCTTNLIIFFDLKKSNKIDSFKASGSKLFSHRVWRMSNALALKLPLENLNLNQLNLLICIGHEFSLHMYQYLKINANTTKTVWNWWFTQPDWPGTNFNQASPQCSYADLTNQRNWILNK